MKIGRNDPCPCGSGKKYKKCCMEDGNIIPFPTKNSSPPQEASLDEYGDYCEFASNKGLPIPTYMEFMGKSNPASEVLGNISDELSNMNFGSEEELKKYMESYVAKQNSSPKEDFLGLKSEHINNLLGSNIEDNSDICEINNKLKYDDIKDVPIIKSINLFLEILDEEGGNLPITTTGNMNLKFCNKFIKRLGGSGLEPGNINSELDVPQISLIKILLMHTGCIDLLRTRVKITAKGRHILIKRDNIVDLFYDVFHFYMNKYNWIIDYDFPEECGFIQDSALFSLYILKSFEGNFFTINHISEIYMKAFPALKKIDQLYYGNITGLVYNILFINEFCINWGMLEVEILDKDMASLDKDNFRLKTSDFFRKLFDWKV